MLVNTCGSVEAASGHVSMLGDRTEGVTMLGERTEGGGRVEALLKRKSLRERHAKLTPGTTVASADMVTACQPHAGLLPAGAPSRGRQSVMHGSPRPSQDSRGGAEGDESATVTSDWMPRSRLVGSELRLGGDLGGESESRSPWTQQECAWREEGAAAAAAGNDRDNLKSYKNCALVNVKGHEGVMSAWPSGWPAAGDAREQGHGLGDAAPGRSLTCHEAARAESAMKEVTQVAHRHCTVPGPVARASGSLARACWWPALALLLALLLPAALGLPAVIRIGKCCPGENV